MCASQRINVNSRCTEALETASLTSIRRESCTRGCLPDLMASHVDESLMLPLGLDSFVCPLFLQPFSPFEVRDVCQSTRNRYN